MGDIRDGLSLTAKLEAAMAVQGTGRSLTELHQSIKCDTIGFREALDLSKKLITNSAEKIAEALGMSKAELESSLEGATENGDDPQFRPMTLKVEGNVDLGIEGKICLGWRDTQGFRMVGVGAAGSVLGSVGGKVFAGRHYSKEMAKIIVGAFNFEFEYIFPIRRIGLACTACNGTGKKSGLRALFNCAKCKGRGCENAAPLPESATEEPAAKEIVLRRPGGEDGQQSDRSEFPVESPDAAVIDAVCAIRPVEEERHEVIEEQEEAPAVSSHTHTKLSGDTEDKSQAVEVGLYAKKEHFGESGNGGYEELGMLPSTAVNH